VTKVLKDRYGSLVNHNQELRELTVANQKRHIIIKRRDSAFQDTELRVWLQSVGINILIFCGIDTSICVETSLRDGFSLGYDVILISDVTSSGIKKHYETTLERVRDYYGIVTNLQGFKKMVGLL
jgi:ureidoacrylate peracid hydrolase